VRQPFPPYRAKRANLWVVQLRLYVGNVSLDALESRGDVPTGRRLAVEEVALGLDEAVNAELADMSRVALRTEESAHLGGLDLVIKSATVSGVDWRALGQLGRQFGSANVA
jgi:hypothetical protein